MAQTVVTSARIDPSLICAARAQLGLSASAPMAVVIRYALALAGGLDPATARLPIGRPRQRQGARSA
jgi:hypothetical protein